MPSWSLPDLAWPPLRERLEGHLDHLQSLESEIDFAVLFGSSARGEEGPGSDLDVLIGLREDRGERFVDRIDRFIGTCPSVEAFPYEPAELREMERQIHFTLLEAADHGRVLFDRGPWAALASRILALVEEGRVVRQGRGWWVKDPGLLAG